MRRIYKQLASPVIQLAQGGSATVITKTMSYDGWDRLTGESVTVGDGTTSGSASDQVSYSYDAVGRMTGRTYGNSSGTNRWRYSGKEEQKALNSTLPLIDYGGY